MKHSTLPRFWQLYRQLPHEIQELADKNYELLKANPRHPSLHFKKLGKKRSYGPSESGHITERWP